MKITPPLTTYSNQAAVARDSKPAGNETTAGSRTAHDDSLTLSDAARRLGSVTSARGALPEADMQRISAYKEAILAGTYKTDSARIANKFYQFNLSLQQVNNHDSI